ncbi:polyketide synthase dehydratase domain-containing protein [Streptomyces sp. M19]
MIAARAALLRALPRGAASVRVEATEEEAAAQLADRGGRVGVAAVDGPESVVLSGAEDDVLDLAAHFQRRGRKVKRLSGCHALPHPTTDPHDSPTGPHDPPTDPYEALTAAYRQAVEKAEFGPAHPGPLPGHRPVRRTRGPAIAGPLDAAAAAHRAVRRRDRRAARPGSHHPAGIRPRRRPHHHRPPVRAGRGVRPRPRRSQDRDGGRGAGRGAAVRPGAVLDRAAYLAGRPARRVDLPTYAFQRERYWLPSGTSSRPTRRRPGSAWPPPATAARRRGRPPRQRHPRVHRTAVRERPRWLADHVVGGRVVFPGTGFVDLALHAARHRGLDQIEELTLRVPWCCPNAAGAAARHARRAGRRASARGHPRPRRGPGPGRGMDPPRERHARRGRPGARRPPRLAARGRGAPGRRRPVRPRCRTRLPLRTGAPGHRAAWRVGDDLCAEVALPAADDTADGAYALHPALLDAALHVPVLHTIERTAAPCSR